MPLSPDIHPLTAARARIAVRGLYGIADAQASGGDPARLGALLLEGGCRLIQLRCKDWDEDQLERVALALRARTAEVGAALVINDHAAIAASVGADGVHLGQLDGPLSDARREAPGLWIGRSTNALDQITHACAEGADYLAYGPVFDTANISRPKPTQGLDHLRRARSLAPDLPLVAIGGVTVANMADVRATGADAWAVIGGIAASPAPAAATRALLVRQS